ncbi:hypothetical protein CDAR_208741 [Caerostris darwini]|uniref:Uncharacterized protein n=1 Tax=Caerostris darwini TaxID=1538125 RepID=A0AAV4VQW0_9ARAC|nr:hypothetical protein CDAR_208741 [Caerostris darwini]
MQIMRDHSEVLLIRGLPFLCFVLCNFRHLEQTVARMGGRLSQCFSCVNGEELMGSRCSRNDGVVLMECIRLRRRLIRGLVFRRLGARKEPSENPLTVLVPDTIHFPIFDADHTKRSTMLATVWSKCLKLHSTKLGNGSPRITISISMSKFRYLDQARMVDRRGRLSQQEKMLLCVNGEELMGSRCSRNDGDAYDAV